MNDLISRQMAIDVAMQDVSDKRSHDFNAGATRAANRIKLLPTVEAEPGSHVSWVPCSERMPEEHEWIGTKIFGTTISDEVYVTFENPKGERFTEHLSFQNGKLSSSDQRKIDAFYKGSVPIAWMPLPKPYEAERKEE
jgi:hypothetical protein